MEYPYTNERGHQKNTMIRDFFNYFKIYFFFFWGESIDFGILVGHVFKQTNIYVFVFCTICFNIICFKWGGGFLCLCLCLCVLAGVSTEV